MAEAGIHSTASSFNTQASDEKPSKHTELQRLRTEYGVAWIMYMLFGRRAEGVKPLRGIFGKARRDRWIPWEIYEASGLFLSLLFLSFNNQPFFIIVALMEYHCSDDKSVASRIFEKGLDYFGDEIDYVLRYLSLLISTVNDENSKPLSRSLKKNRHRRRLLRTPQLGFNRYILCR